MHRKFIGCNIFLLLALLAVSGAAQDSGKQYLPKPWRALAQKQAGAELPARVLQTRIAGGAAVKITVREAGLYRVTAGQLHAAGLPLTAAAARLQLFESGVEYPLLARSTGNLLGADDYIEFYGVGADTNESDTRVYWLIEGERPGLRMGWAGNAQPDKPAGQSFVAASTDGEQLGGDGLTGGYAVSALRPSVGAATNFPYTVEKKERVYYFPQIQNGGAADNFFGGAVRNSPEAAQILRVVNLDPSAQTPARVYVKLQGATPGEHRVAVKLNGQAIGEMVYGEQNSGEATFSFVHSLLREGENTLSYAAQNGPNDISVLDTARITYTRLLRAENDKLLFTVRGSRVSVGGFSTRDIRLFDLSDPQSIAQAPARVVPAADGYALIFKAGVMTRAMFALADGQTLAPLAVTANEPSDWAGREHRADFLIVTPKAFRAAMEPLAWLRRGAGLRTEIVNLEDIYDEWNSGNKSVAALRGFLRYTQTNWEVAPRYVLLVGDASYDPRNYLGQGNYDFLPTAYANTEFLETSSDALLADANGDSIEDFALGRLPARTPEQAAQMVSKIVNYQPYNGPRPDLLLVTDHADDNDFETAHDELSAMLPANTNFQDIRRLNRTVEQMRADTLAALNAGPSIVQYSGHGLIESWSTGNYLTSPDAPALTNSRASVVLTMSCLNGYFHDLGTESLAEALLRSPRGAAAVWASSALTYADGQIPMSQSWFRQIYGPGTAPRLGEAIRRAKADSFDPNVRKTWILFGDPTLRVRQ